MIKMDKALEDVLNEYNRASLKFSQFRSPHEGYAILLEEVDELWDEIKGDKKPDARSRMKKEAIQVAAMALRFIKMLNNTDRPICSNCLLTMETTEKPIKDLDNNVFCSISCLEEFRDIDYYQLLDRPTE